MTVNEVKLVSYMDLSAMFPLPKSSDGSWNELMRRFRTKGQLVKGRHYKLQYFGNLRYMYNLRSVVRLICLEARKDPPLPTAFYLADEYYDQFCAILTAEQNTQASQLEQSSQEPIDIPQE